MNKYLLLSPNKDLLGIFMTDDIRAAKQIIRTKYPFGTHFTAASVAEFNIRKISILNIKQIKL